MYASNKLDVDGVINATDGNSTNWNSAFGWGDHSTAGYLTSTSANELTNKTGNISMWTNDSGYLTSASSLSASKITGTIAEVNISNGSYMINSAGTNGQVWMSSGSGRGFWGTVAGDNLGNHTATQNIKLGSYWLSGDGGNEGVFVNASGNVGINDSNPTRKFVVSSGTTGLPADLAANIVILGKGSQYVGLGLMSATNGVSFLHLGDSDGGKRGGIDYYHTTDSMSIFTAGTERINISNSGKIRMGTGTVSNERMLNLVDNNNTGLGTGLTIKNTSSSSHSFSVIQLFGNDTTVQSLVYADGLGTGPLGTPHWTRYFLQIIKKLYWQC